MGELIKNLSPISIGDSSLMIELNEGYVKEEGRLIHIQNAHFRYLLPEKDFVSFAASVLRAKEEMNYVRKRISSSIRREIATSTLLNNKEEQKAVAFIVDLLDKHRIPYRLVEIRDKVCTFLIKYEAFNSNCFVSSGIKELIHPYSEELGYIYLYQMHPFKLFKIDSVFIEIYFELPCYSLTDKTWIPLHRLIQKRVFENDSVENGIHLLDGLSYSIYRLGWAVYKKRVISEFDVEVIKSNRELLLSEVAIPLLYEVFYKYTENLRNHIRNEEYDVIVEDYFNFYNY